MRSLRSATTLLAAAGLATGLALATTLPASASLDKTISSKQLKALTNSLNKGNKLTYQATYTSVQGTQTQTVTIAQSPPKSNFTAGSGSAISDGKTTYYCSTSDGKQQCLSIGGSNPLLGLEDLFSPSVAIGAFSEARQGLASRLLGIKTSVSSATFAGQPSTCVTVTVHGKAGKYCVTNHGILAYAGTSSTQNFTLTKYSSSPPASLFSLPAGATQVTLPTGVSIPSIP